MLTKPNPLPNPTQLGFNSWFRYIQRFIYRAHTVRRRRVDFKLCLHNNVWVAAAQELVAAIYGEDDRLLSLDLSSLGDGSQLPGRAAITNSGQGSTLAHRDSTHTDKTSMCGPKLRHICGTTVCINLITRYSS
jgi:hypothetical protein